MRRRTLLARAGTVLGAGTVAGCLSEDDTVGGGTDDTATDEPTTGDPTTDRDGDTQRPAEIVTPEPGEDPVATIPLGDREDVAFPDNNRPHEVHLVNAADHGRAIRGDVRRSDSLVRQIEAQVPTRGYVRVTLQTPATYTVDVAVDDDRQTVTVERQQFDCNSSLTTVAVPASGSLDTRVESTMAGCVAPEVGDATVESGEGDCADDQDDRAQVTVDSEIVRIDGTVVTATPCHRATLAEARVTERTLTVVVEATPTDDACVECVGAIPYEGVVEMAHDHPDVVRVVHRGPRGERTVTDTTL